MFNKSLIIVQIVLLLLGVGQSFAYAEDNASKLDKITINTSVADGEIRNYKVNVVTTGKIPVPESNQNADIDTTASLSIQHKYGKHDIDGKMTLETSVTDVQVCADGQKIAVPSGTYPKLTILLDSNWNIKDIFGITGTRYTQSLPGINYANMIILFYLNGKNAVFAPGDKWDSNITIAAFGETYKIKNTMIGVREVDGIKSALVHQDINWSPKAQADNPYASVGAKADTYYALSDGKLVESHITSTLVFSDKFSGKKNKDACKANTKIDISLIK